MVGCLLLGWVVFLWDWGMFLGMGVDFWEMVDWIWGVVWGLSGVGVFDEYGEDEFCCGVCFVFLILVFYFGCDLCGC